MNKKSCLNCRHWHDINKTLDVYFNYNVSRKVGICDLAINEYDKYSIETYDCEKFKK